MARRSVPVVSRAKSNTLLIEIKPIALFAAPPPPLRQTQKYRIDIYIGTSYSYMDNKKQGERFGCVACCMRFGAA
ncbi:hypothetical protein PX554_04170 [Sphingomonas sp. H39-1-10]|uniref:hypothetical protein n=1 Tax=Sphingomonas pollutisoli TaxID=3030829 RepID=UPI0023B8B6A1|nr:hypothetical protein [Sphingomonas pollutisoli]MDF0487314.1 hypothetical protein [Sphingomonas pollutisoli]